jgi:hypothetical protein
VTHRKKRNHPGVLGTNGFAKNPKVSRNLFVDRLNIHSFRSRPITQIIQLVDKADVRIHSVLDPNALLTEE